MINIGTIDLNFSVDTAMQRPRELIDQKRQKLDGRVTKQKLKGPNGNQLWNAIGETLAQASASVFLVCD